MLFTEDEMTVLNGDGVQTRNALRWSEHHWPKSTVVYSLDERFRELLKNYETFFLC